MDFYYQFTATHIFTNKAFNFITGTLQEHKRLICPRNLLLDYKQNITMKTSNTSNPQTRNNTHNNNDNDETKAPVELTAPLVLLIVALLISVAANLYLIRLVIVNKLKSLTIEKLSQENTVNKILSSLDQQNEMNEAMYESIEHKLPQNNDVDGSNNEITNIVVSTSCLYAEVQKKQKGDSMTAL